MPVGRSQVKVAENSTLWPARQALGWSFLEWRSISSILPAQVQGNVGFMPGRDPNALPPFGNASQTRGPDGVLSFGEKGKPEVAGRVGLRSLEMAAVSGLQGYVSVSDGLALEVQHLAADGAEAPGGRRGNNAERRRGAQQCTQKPPESHGRVLSSWGDIGNSILTFCA